MLEVSIASKHYKFYGGRRNPFGSPLDALDQVVNKSREKYKGLELRWILNITGISLSFFVSQNRKN